VHHRIQSVHFPVALQRGALALLVLSAVAWLLVDVCILTPDCVSAVAWIDARIHHPGVFQEKVLRDSVTPDHYPQTDK
jgi:hypothetical protein